LSTFSASATRRCSQRRKCYAQEYVIQSFVFARSVAVGAISGALVATCGICGTGLWANIAGGAAIGAGLGALGYAADRGIEYMQTGTLEWDWGQFGLSVGIGAAAGAAGAAGGY
jgi:hypothetical protein